MDGKQQGLLVKSVGVTVVEKGSWWVRWIKNPYLMPLSWLGLAVVLVAIFIWLLLTRSSFTLSTYKPNVVIEKSSGHVIIQEKLVYIHREEVNKIVQNYMENNRSDQVFSFYDRLTGSRKITLLLVTSALSQDIPLNMLLAIAKRESEFNPQAFNPYDHDGTYDVGLLQLNTGTFPDYTKAQLFDPAFNVRVATTYFRSLYNKYHSWDEAILAYNGGRIDNVSKRVISYLVGILAIEHQYDAQFALSFGG